VACAAALATIEVIEDGLVANAAETGAYLKAKLAALRPNYPMISDVRGLGLMIGAEFASTDGNDTPDRQLRDRIMRLCFEKGLLLLSCGDSTLRFCPPLIVRREEVDTALRIFEAAIAEAMPLR